MKNTMEYLEELDEAIHELMPLIDSDDAEGIYRHEEIKVRATPEELEQLIVDIRGLVEDAPQE